MRTLIRNRLERIRYEAKKEAREYQLKASVNLKEKELLEIISDSWVIKIGRAYHFSPGAKVLLFLIKTSKKRFTSTFEKDLARRDWESNRICIREYFILKERLKMLGIKAELNNEIGKDFDDYRIEVWDALAVTSEKEKKDE